MGETKIGGLIPTELRQLLFTPEDMVRLAGMGEVRWNESAEQMSTIEAIELLQGCTVGIGSWATPWPDAELLEGLPGAQVMGACRRYGQAHVRRASRRSRPDYRDLCSGHRRERRRNYAGAIDHRAQAHVAERGR